MPDMSSAFYPEIVRGAEDVANIYNYNIILCNTDLDTGRERDYLRVLKEKMVDGIIYMSNSLAPEILQLTKELDLPTVLVETNDDEKIFPSVTIDNEGAAVDATSYLLQKGNKSIAYIGTHYEVKNASAKRYLGYKKALEDAGIKVDSSKVVFTGLKAKHGEEAIEELTRRNVKFDAIVCGSDELAMGAINKMREKGIKVPEDVDVVSFNNTYVASIYYPKLTTIDQPSYDMGSVGMRMLIKIINKKPLDVTQYVLPHNLIERDSCKR